MLLIKAIELHETTPNSFVPQQFANLCKSEIHRLTTAQEILKDTDGKIDIFFVAAIGTGGTITGIGEVLKLIILILKLLLLSLKHLLY